MSGSDLSVSRRALPFQAAALKRACVAGLAAGCLIAGSPRSGPAEELRVGVKPTPPFVMQASDGSWTGISIRLWEEIADSLDVEYVYEEHTLESLLDGVSTGRLDAAVAALTITAERELQMDFTHPFYGSGLGILVEAQKRSGVMAVMGRLLSMDLIKALGALVLILFVAGFVVWVFERRRNDQFGGDAASGLGSAFWWSAVTMTTVGYGDKAPVTVGGRAVALVWMFASIVLISGLTAAITSALTVAQLESPVQGPEDLAKVRVGTVEASTSAQYLEGRGLSARTYDGVAQAVEALVDGRVDAVVYDAPILRYLAHRRRDDAYRVLPRIFEGQDYAIALAAGSPRLEQVNRALLRITGSEAWGETIREYLGDEPM